MRLAAAFAVLAGPVAAFCGAEGDEAAKLFSGTWTVSIVEAVITVGAINHIAPVSDPQTAMIDLQADGTGTLSLGGTALPLARRAPGQFHLDATPDRRAAFDTLLVAQGTRPDCALADLPQVLAENTAATGARRAVSLTDLVLVDDDLIAGVQYTLIRDPNAPLVKVLTTMTLKKTGP